MIIINQSDGNHETDDSAKGSEKGHRFLSQAKSIASLIQCALSCKAWHSSDQRLPILRDGKVSEYYERKACIEPCNCEHIKTYQNCERAIMSLLSDGNEKTKMSLDDGVRLSGMLQNMTHDEFKRAFNDNEAALEELKELLFLCDKKPVIESTTEELQNNIDILERACNLLSVIKLSKKAKLSDIIDNAEESEREEIRKRDRSYKVKPVVEKEKPKSSAVKDREKLLKTFKSMGMTEKEAEEEYIRLMSREDNKKDKKAEEKAAYEASLKDLMK